MLDQQVQLVVLLSIQLGMHQLPLLLSERIRLILEHFIQLVYLLDKPRINPVLLLFLLLADHERRRDELLVTHDGDILELA